jgi:hypothetical protein
MNGPYGSWAQHDVFHLAWFTQLEREKHGRLDERQCRRNIWHWECTTEYLDYLLSTFTVLFALIFERRSEGSDKVQRVLKCSNIYIVYQPYIQ